VRAVPGQRAAARRGQRRRAAQVQGK
jgi:hypothetical protein